jgi:alanyl-tRNA synthetase
MNSNQIRQQFLDFYAAREHQILPAEPFVVPMTYLNDISRTNLWTLPFYPLSLGEKHPPENHSATLQKYISPNIQVLTQRHPTFFEMLTHWGDYSKQQALTWAWELCTEIYQIGSSRLVVSVDERDTETLAIWRDKIGVPEQQIIISRWNSWRPNAGGHCGISTRIHYDCYPERGYESAALEEDIEFRSKSKEEYDREDRIGHILSEEDLRFLSFYHLVFMESEASQYGNQRTPLKTNYMACGMDLERLATILQGCSSFYQTDLILPIIRRAAKVAGVDYDRADSSTKIALRLIADHMRSVVHLKADYYYLKPRYNGGNFMQFSGLNFINKLIQMWIMRIALYSQILGIEEPFVELLIDKIVTWGEAFYPHLRQQQQEIVGYLTQQESYCWSMLEGDRKKGIVSGYLLDKLFRTYNCYRQDIERWAEKKGITIDWDGYNLMLGPEID